MENPCGDRPDDLEITSIGSLYRGPWDKKYWSCSRNPCGDRPDDLEITSIGSLYRGPWDKKYWSCSRGKDRYPYPVGYHAVRTHGGNICRMEIHEGPKGPLFVVTSTDGDSSTGQTPDIAWEQFQKKCSPRVKNWHGKRFSSKIDGVELFGFRNPFVQRLLRELVANVSGAAEHNFLSPNSNNRASKLDHEIQIQDAHTYPDLLLYLEKQQSTRKRSTKSKNSTKSLQKEARAKRICCDTGGGTSKQLRGFCSRATINGTKHCQEEHFSLSKSKCPTIHDTPNHFTYTPKGSTCALNDVTLEPDDTEGEGNGRNTGFATSVNNCSEHEHLGNSLLQEPPVVEGDCSPFLGEGEQPAEVGNSDCVVEKHVISCEESKLEDCVDSRFTSPDSPPSNAENTLLDRSGDAQLEQGDSKDRSVDIHLEQGYSKDNDGEIPVLKMSASICVPDTCDAAKGDIAGFTSACCKGSPCSMKSEPAATKLMLRTSTSYDLEVISRTMPHISKHSSSKCVHPMQEEVLHYVKSSPDDALSKGMIKDSLPEVGSSSGSSGPGSEKNDLDLSGQELARSMMVFLLPQAVPLLKKTYVKRRSRHQNQEAKIDPSSILSRANSAEQKIGDRLTANVCQDNLGAGMLLQESENIHERKNDLHTLLNVNFQEKMTKVEDLVTGCTTNELLTNSGRSKDIKSIIPDSFEDDQYGHDTTIKRPSPTGFDDADDAPAVEIKQNIDASESLSNDAGGVREPSDCLIRTNECDGGDMLINELEKGENLLSDSLVAFLEEEFNDECMNGGEKKSSPGPCLNVNCTDDMMSLDPAFVKHDNSQHFINESMVKAEKEILISECMPQHISLGNGEANHFEQDPPASTPDFNNFEEKGIHEIVEPLEKGLKNSSQHDLVIFGVCSTVESRDVNIRKQVGWLHGQTVISGKGDSSICIPDAVLPTNGLPHDCGKAGKLPHSPHSTRKYDIPLSESIICRNCDSNALEACFAPKTSGTVEDGHSRPTKNIPNTDILFANEIDIDEHVHITNKMENTSTSAATLSTACPVFSQIQDGVRNVTGYTKFSNFSDPSLSCSTKNHADSISKLHSSKEFCIPQVQNVLEQSRNDVLGALSSSNKSPPTELTVSADCQVLLHDHLCQRNKFDANSKKEFRDSMELVGCYLHPNPVLSIFLISKEDFLQICVLCGLLEGNDRYLFIYTVPRQEQSESCPSFIGYTSLVFPLFKGPSNGKIPYERSGLQFTPDGQSLVFLNSIRAPHCREQNVSCLCSMCRLGCSEENAVKVVQVKFGYVSPVIKLTTVERLSCLLVCEPNYLIAVEESGRLHVWIMNSTWSGKLEEFMLPSFDHIAPKVLELKRIPKHDFLIVGHNGIGGFGLWDISRQVLLAKFSAPGHMIFQILPVGVFSLQNKGILATSLEIKEHMKETANNWATEAVEDSFLLTSGENVAVWVLISAVSDLEAQHHRLVKEPCASSVGCWRLALLANNMVVVGSVLDPRASALDASADHGIIGTFEGLLYKWELSTGKKVATMHSFKCGSVSCIAVDAQSGVVAVAGDKCQLLLYTQQRGELQS